MQEQTRLGHGRNRALKRHPQSAEEISLVLNQALALLDRANLLLPATYVQMAIDVIECFPGTAETERKKRLHQ